MKQWIRENRAEIDRAILHVCPNAARLNDRERELWIRNYHPLYCAAYAGGVTV
jgi:hypothetical protein